MKRLWIVAFFGMLSFSPHAALQDRLALGGVLVGGLGGGFGITFLYAYLRTSQFVDGVECPHPRNVVSYCCESTCNGGFNSDNCTLATSYLPIICPGGSVAQCQMLPKIFSPPRLHYSNGARQIAAAVLGGAGLTVAAVSIAYALLSCGGCTERRQNALVVFH
jgi:hypothetical protein